MMWVKDPLDIRWFEFDWSQFLAAGETISSYTITCDSNLTKVAQIATGTAVSIQVSGGVAGTQSVISCQVDTSVAGNQENQYETQKVVAIRTRRS